MVIVAVPTVAEPLTASVRVLVEVAGLELNDAVTPLGTPVATRVTFPAKLPVGLMVIVLVPLAPCATVKVFGAAVRVKFPDPDDLVTVSAIVVVALRLPEVPVMVTVAVPAVAVLLAVTAMALVEVAGLGLKAAVTPFGSPEAANVTLPENEFAGVMVIVLVPLAPCAMLRVAGAAERVKLGLLVGQLFTRLAAFTVPIPVAKSQPVLVPYAI